MNSEPDPSLDDIDAVLRFLPVIEAPGFYPGHLHSAPTEDGAGSAPSFEGSLEFDQLIQALYDHHWVLDFDWSEWQPVADRYLKNPTLLRDVGLGTLRKLFTTHVRKERFCDGHLAEILRSGHLAQLLRRLQEIRAGLQL
jgi:hypothetical protein